MDRGCFGYPSGYFYYYRYGLLARELGNKTWIAGSNRQDNEGEAAQEYYLRYGELPYFV
jgi:hypothetical protein